MKGHCLPLLRFCPQHRISRINERVPFLCHALIILFHLGLCDISVYHAQMSDHLQAGDLTESQDGILQLLEEGSWYGCNELVPQGFVHIVVQLEIPAVFTVETDGISGFCRGGFGSVDRQSCEVDGEEKSYGGCGGSVLISGHCESEVTMESATKWHEDTCHIYVELGACGLGYLEGGVYGSVSNVCQGSEQEVRYDGFDDGHSVDD